VLDLVRLNQHQLRNILMVACVPQYVHKKKLHIHGSGCNVERIECYCLRLKCYLSNHHPLLSGNWGQLHFLVDAIL
jgi:hypothetical protein